MRKIRYQEIAESLRREIEAGEYGAGQVLPSEASLGEIHRASRVTIRKALELLRTDGLVESRQGFGWMVAAELIPQSLDALVSIERQLANSGRRPKRQIVDFKFVAPEPTVAAVLGPRVLEVRRVNTADGQPFARVTVWCREDLALELSQAQVAEMSFYELIPGPKRASQTIGAELMTSIDAELLDVPPQSAALVVRRTTFGADDQAILMSEHTFPGHLTEFVAQLSKDGDDGAGQTGFRLVGGD